MCIFMVTSRFPWKLTEECCYFLSMYIMHSIDSIYLDNIYMFQYGPSPCILPNYVSQILCTSSSPLTNSKNVHHFQESYTHQE